MIPLLFHAFLESPLILLVVSSGSVDVLFDPKFSHLDLKDHIDGSITISDFSLEGIPVTGDINFSYHKNYHRMTVMLECNSSLMFDNYKEYIAYGDKICIVTTSYGLNNGRIESLRYLSESFTTRFGKSSVGAALQNNKYIYELSIYYHDRP